MRSVPTFSPKRRSAPSMPVPVREAHPSVANEDNPAVELSAVIVGFSKDEPQVLVVHTGKDTQDALPSGTLEAEHRTLEMGLRSWVERRTHQSLGYVEQLYTFGDRNRTRMGPDRRRRVLSIGYLALVRETRVIEGSGSGWRGWYRYFPWEDWRHGKPRLLARIERELKRWIADAPAGAERPLRAERARAAFTLGQRPWSDERVLERYELLYELGLVPEAHRDRANVWAPANRVLDEAHGMFADHRRMLATAITRLRSKIKYRPVVFELLAPEFTFLQLQRAVEALAGLRLHKPNFRRLVESQGLVEETGQLISVSAGRPARLLRYRPCVVFERPAPGARLPIAREPR